MSRDLLLLLLGLPLIDAMAFDDDDDEGSDDDSDDDDDDGGDDTDDDDSSGDTKKKDDGKKKDEDKPERKSKSTTPEALKRQVADLQKKLREKNTRIGNLTRERASLRRQTQGKDKKPPKSDEDDSEVTQLRQSVADLTERLENISSENFIEKNVIRKLQNRITAGLEEDEAERKLNAAMRLVDAEEDFDEDGNFDVDGFLERHPYMVTEGETKEETNRNRLIGGSGRKNKSKKDYASDAVKKFNEARDRKAVKK